MLDFAQALRPVAEPRGVCALRDEVTDGGAVRLVRM